MLKRIFTIALLTGAGQLFVVFALKYISQNSSPEQVKAIGQIDSLVLFIMNVIAFGLQPSAMRNLALTDNWKEEYNNTQTARFTLSIFIASFALFAFIDPYYLVFLIAPLLALSGDYALYGRGLPVKGAIISFTRAVFPFSLLIVCVAYQFQWMSSLYLASLILIFIITNHVISGFLQTKYSLRFRLIDLKLYLKSLSLGAVALSIYFLGLGLVLVSSYFYSAPVVAVAYLGLKFYVIFKGVLRMIHQAFVRDMVDDKICLKIDQLSSLVGLALITFSTIFPKTFISLFFGPLYSNETSFFLFITASAFIYSMFASITTKALLEKKDSQYSIIYIISSLIALIFSIIFSINFDNAAAISLSLLIGECVFFSLALYFLSSRIYMKDRFKFYIRNMAFIVIPLSFRMIFSDATLPFILSAFLFLVGIGITHFKKFYILS